MKENQIYKTSELPDSLLEEFEEIEQIFLLVIVQLSEKFSASSINAGMSKAILEFIRNTANPSDLKNALINQAAYFKQAAELYEEKM